MHVISTLNNNTLKSIEAWIFQCLLKSELQVMQLTNPSAGWWMGGNSKSEILWLNWTGLHYIQTENWAGLDSTGLEWTSLYPDTKLDWLDWAGLPTVSKTKLDWTGLPAVSNTKLDSNWTGMDSTGLPALYLRQNWSIQSMFVQCGRSRTESDAGMG